jgi:hypothetical protein
VPGSGAPEFRLSTCCLADSYAVYVLGACFLAVDVLGACFLAVDVMRA